MILLKMTQYQSNQLNLTLTEKQCIKRFYNSRSNKKCSIYDAVNGLGAVYSLQEESTVNKTWQSIAYGKGDN